MHRDSNIQLEERGIITSVYGIGETPKGKLHCFRI